MPNSKNRKFQNIPLESISGDCLNVLNEMLSIILNRTLMDTNDQNFIHSPGNLRYFGDGYQLKVSKLADTLYSTLKDVLLYVISELAKDSTSDIKFQVPKHTSFVGTIVKNVGIDVIARNPNYRIYLRSLAESQGKYPFNMNNDVFQSIYKDTVLKMEERNLLFEDDPELAAIQQMEKGLSVVDLPNSMNSMIGEANLVQFTEKMEENSDEDEEVESEEASNARKRVILPYLRRLFESKKAAVVTLKRVDLVIDVMEPDEEMKMAFQQKYEEEMKLAKQNSMGSLDVIQGHCLFATLTYLKSHYPKERVEIMEKFLQREKTNSSKARKRYVKVPSGKRPHYQEPMQEFLPVTSPMNPEHLLPI